MIEVTIQCGDKSVWLKGETSAEIARDIVLAWEMLWDSLHPEIRDAKLAEWKGATA